MIAQGVNWLPLIGLGVIVLGVVLRFNLALTMVASALVTAVLGGRSVQGAVSLLGHFFLANRYLAILFAVFPLVGLLERRGLGVASQGMARRVGLTTPGAVLRAYFFLRQISVAMGLTSFGGHAQMVRPVIAPMVENAAERMAQQPASNPAGMTPDRLQALRTQAAAIDNIAAFFGEDIFVAFVSILFIQATLESFDLHVSPWQLSCWALPAAAMAGLITCWRTIRLDRRLREALARREGGA